MSLDKGIAHGKEFRKPYYKSGKIDESCRPGRDCPRCEGNRMHSTKRRELSAREQIQEAVKRNMGEAWIGGTPGDQGIMAARGDDLARRRAAIESADQAFRAAHKVVRSGQLEYAVRKLLEVHLNTIYNVLDSARETVGKS